MMDIVTLGECMALLYPSEPIPLESARQLSLDIAGAESNISIALSRLGHRVRFISRVGDDPFGRRIRAILQQEGVDTTYLAMDSETPTGVFFREWLPDGMRRVYYYRAGSAASRLAPDDLPEEAFASARVVHLTGITPALSESCAAAVVRAIDLARAVGAVVSFDPNYRSRLWAAAGAQAVLLPFMRQADILLMGDEDALALFGEGDEETYLRHGAELGASVVVLKRGERGAMALANGKVITVPAYPVEEVADPVGAGDGFDAGFLSGWLKNYDLEAALRLGARMGASAVTTLSDYAGYLRQAEL